MASPDGCGGGGSWIDITADIERCSKHLDVGEMITSKDFNLYDSMTAVEMMDPKMDSGMRPPVVSAEDRIKIHDENVASRVKLDIKELVSHQEDVLRTLFGMVIFEATFLDGCAIGQTVYSCAFVHNSVANIIRKGQFRGEVCPFKQFANFAV